MSERRNNAMVEGHNTQIVMDLIPEERFGSKMLSPKCPMNEKFTVGSYSVTN